MDGFTLVFMETHLLNRFSPLQLNAGHTLKNRIVVPPMASGTATTAGLATEKTRDHYAKLARSGAGLVIVEYTFVHPSGRSEENQLGISCEEHIEGLAALAKVIQQNGARAGIQITHSGAKSNLTYTGGNLMGPSAIAVAVKGAALQIPQAMTMVDIALWKVAFANAARRAALAGFDLIEFHSAHGYGLNQWLSPITNHRQDEFGIDLKGRSRLLQEIVQQTREQYPALLLSVRMPGQDFLEGGLSPQDGLEVAKMLERSGIDLIHVSSGIGGWRRPLVRIGEGYLVAEATKIQQHVAIPVIGVGGIETGDYIDRSLFARKFSLAAVGRAILQDPELWAQKNMQQAKAFHLA
jgi:NADPH2 dehydrogenase